MMDSYMILKQIEQRLKDLSTVKKKLVVEYL